MGSVFAQDNFKCQMNRDNVAIVSGLTVFSAILTTTNAADAVRTDLKREKDNVLN